MVVVDGILNRSRYQRMLERLRDRSSSAHFFAWDLEFDETLRRHEQRPQRTVFTPEDMAPWYHGWNPLDFVDETRFDEAVTVDDAVERIATAITGGRCCSDRLRNVRSAAFLRRVTRRDPEVCKAEGSPGETAWEAA